MVINIYKNFAAAIFTAYINLAYYKASQARIP